MSVERILLTGSSGFIGTSLVRKSKTQTDCNDYTCIGDQSAQRQYAASCGIPTRQAPVSHPEGLEGTTAAVHLSGVNLAGAALDLRLQTGNSGKPGDAYPRAGHSAGRAKSKARGAGLRLGHWHLWQPWGRSADRGLFAGKRISARGMPCLGKGDPAGHGRWDPRSASPFWGCAFAPRRRPGADAAHLPRRPGRPAGQRPSVDELGRAAGCESGRSSLRCRRRVFPGR